MSKAKRKQLPRFESEEQERSFWADHDPADFVDWADSSGLAWRAARAPARGSRHPSAGLEQWDAKSPQSDDHPRQET
jgi:hypothetical protein